MTLKVTLSLIIILRLYPKIIRLIEISFSNTNRTSIIKGIAGAKIIIIVNLIDIPEANH